MAFRSNQLEQWNLRFQEMVDFKKENGHCLVPLQYEKNPSLAHWVKRQRNQYQMKKEGKHSTMTYEREAALERLGFVWDSHAAVWEERLGELRKFRNIFGHCRVPKRKTKLSVWVKCQRRQFKLYNEGKESNMTPQRVIKLNELGFDFFPRANKRTSIASVAIAKSVAAGSTAAAGRLSAVVAATAAAPRRSASVGSSVSSSSSTSSPPVDGRPSRISFSEEDDSKYSSHLKPRRRKKEDGNQVNTTTKKGVLSAITPAGAGAGAGTNKNLCQEQICSNVSSSSTFTGCQRQGQQQMQQAHVDYHQTSLPSASTVGRGAGSGSVSGGPSTTSSQELQQILSLLTQISTLTRGGGGGGGGGSTIDSINNLDGLLRSSLMNTTTNPDTPIAPAAAAASGAQAAATPTIPVVTATGQLGLVLLGLTVLLNGSTNEASSSRGVGGNIFESLPPIGNIVSEILNLSSTSTATLPPQQQPQQQLQDPLLAALLQQQQQQSQQPSQQPQQQVFCNTSGSSQLEQIKEQYVNMAAASLVANSLGSSPLVPPPATTTTNSTAGLSSILGTAGLSSILGTLAQPAGTTTMPTTQQQQQQQQQQQIPPEILNLLLSAGVVNQR